MIQEIQLPNGTWKFDSSRQLGDKGGFGTVFEGYSDQLGELAVKRLHLDAQAAAHREMEIAEELLGKSYKNVIPIYDAGLDDKSGGYFVVMARAE
jgi:serine/threonine protein kinase